MIKKGLQSKVVLLIAIILVTSLFFKLYYLSNPALSIQQSQSFEQDLKNIPPNASFSVLKKYFQKLAQQQGADYAFRVLKASHLPPNTDLHLLGHVVGDILYKQKGVEGIKVCTDDFRNACSHSIVVGLYLDKGEKAIPEIAKACEQAPGGSGAYTMCFHGLGHGILAAVDFNVAKAVGICQKIGGIAGKGGEGPQCMGGIVMEIVGGGDHDKATWSKQRNIYLIKNDPLGLCSSDLIPEDGKIFCYMYITPFLWESVGTNLGKPEAIDMKKAFPLCDQIPFDQAMNRDACYGGFGKEFVGLVAARDIRKVDQMELKQMKRIYDLCLFADTREASISCIIHVVNSLYWGGENDRHGALRFCSVMEDRNYQQTCYTNLIIAVQAYIKDTNYKKQFCQEVPNGYKTTCIQKLL